MGRDVDGVAFFRLTEAQPAEPFAGIVMRGIRGAAASLSVVDLAPDALLPLHSHPHEQLGLIVEGSLILIVGGVEHRIGPGEGYAIPGGVEHAGRGGPEGARAIDVFIPPREEYRSSAAPARTGLG
jgi:quercetin dioxygenase-like cupin family protein